MFIQPESTSISLSPASVYQTDGDIESQLLGCQWMLRELINHVESTQYEFECGLTSGIRMLKTIFDETSEVKELINLCKDRSVAVFILGHMIELCTRKFDTKYRNPLEMAVTTYLHVIIQSRTDLHSAAASAARLLKGGVWPERYIQTYLK